MTGKTQLNAAFDMEAAALSAQTTGRTVDAEQRHRMIAEAAYFKAVARDFQDGYEWEDWLEAEAEIDERLRP